MSSLAMPRRTRKVGKGGFTLLELIVVLLVLGVLAAIAVPTFATVKSNSAQRTFQATADAVARNAAAIAISEGAAAVTTAHIAAAAAEAGFSDSSTTYGDLYEYYNDGFTAGVINGLVGTFECTATVTPGTGTDALTASASTAVCTGGGNGGGSGAPALDLSGRQYYQMIFTGDNSPTWSSTYSVLFTTTWGATDYYSFHRLDEWNDPANAQTVANYCNGQSATQRWTIWDADPTTGPASSTEACPSAVVLLNKNFYTSHLENHIPVEYLSATWSSTHTILWVGGYSELTGHAYAFINTAFWESPELAASMTPHYCERVGWSWTEPATSFSRWDGDPFAGFPTRSSAC